MRVLQFLTYAALVMAIPNTMPRDEPSDGAVSEAGGQRVTITGSISSIANALSTTVSVNIDSISEFAPLPPI
jgi:hypothetical protein